jgi:hypothetical protein
MRRPPAGKDMSTQAEDIVEIRYQAMTSEDMKDSTCCNEK